MLGEVMSFDKPWEGDGCGYHVIVPDQDVGELGSDTVGVPGELGELGELGAGV